MPPPIHELLEAVETANLTWQENREQTNSGKAKQKFGKLCKSLDSHKELMAVIPQGDKYVSLLTGTFSAIVKVRVPSKSSENVQYTRIKKICKKS